MTSLVECFKKGDYTGYDVTKSIGMIYRDVYHFCHILSKYVNYNHNMDTLCVDTSPIQFINSTKSRGYTLFDRGLGM